MIQQVVEAQLILVGDGTSTTFSFDLGRVYGLYFPPGPEVQGPTSGSIAPLGVLNADAIPDGVSFSFAKLPDQSNLPGTVTLSISRRMITATFSQAPASGSFFLGLSFLFNG